jgi:hypothetical protein
MTPEPLEARLNKLITYTKRLAEDHNKLEQKVKILEERLELVDHISAEDK